MNYNTESVRRQDRLLNEQAAIELLSGGEYGVLSLQAEAGGGYGIPINYVGMVSRVFMCIVPPMAKSCVVLL